MQCHSQNKKPIPWYTVLYTPSPFTMPFFVLEYIRRRRYIIFASIQEMCEYKICMNIKLTFFFGYNWLMVDFVNNNTKRNWLFYSQKLKHVLMSSFSTENCSLFFKWVFTFIILFKILAQFLFYLISIITSTIIFTWQVITIFNLILNVFLFKTT